MTLLLALLLAMQTAPLRKSDLVRLLSVSAMSPVELAQLVRRNCLTFAPTGRDRTDFLRLGADRSLLDAMDQCVRSRSVPVAPRPQPPPASQPARATTVAPPAAAPRTRAVSASRSGFTAGGGQRGVAGAQLSRALVFEARDSLGTPIARASVVFTGINARIEPDTVATDISGLARAGVILGERAGSASVIASAGDVEKQVAFNVGPGPAAQLVVLCGQGSIATHVAIRPDSGVTLRVAAQDAFGNGTPLLGLRAAVADARIFRVLRVAQDSVSGTVALKPDQPGTTSLALIANGIRQYLTVTVPPKAAPGKVDCR